MHLPATVAAAAPHQHARGRVRRLLLRPADVRHAVREGREGNLVLFAVDASGSMAAKARMAAVTGAVLSLLRDAYQRRDKVGLITFRGAGAELVLPPTSSVPAARVRLDGLRTGGRTPLARGLLRARKVLAVERLRDPRRRALLVVLTDGRATVGLRRRPRARRLPRRRAPRRRRRGHRRGGLRERPGPPRPRRADRPRPRRASWWGSASCRPTGSPTWSAPPEPHDPPVSGNEWL